MTYTKSPLEIDPEGVWILKRRNALDDAINRYIEAGMPIPSKWIEESRRHENGITKAFKKQEWHHEYDCEAMDKEVKRDGTINIKNR